MEGKSHVMVLSLSFIHWTFYLQYIAFSDVYISVLDKISSHEILSRRNLIVWRELKRRRDLLVVEKVQETQVIVDV